MGTDRGADQGGTQLGDDDGLDGFRRRARAWLAEHGPGARRPGEDEVTSARRFQAELFEGGFAGLTWPRAWGGQELPAAAVSVFNEESQAYDIAQQPFAVTMGMCGPTLVDLGTDEQRRRHVPAILRGDEIWCQLFSEPGAGSDVASLQTRAVRDGDGWIVNGSKVWTSGAQYADFGALLARTNVDVPKHQGLTMFIVDMHAPGVTVRPLVDMSGRAPFNEVFFEDVRLPADAVLGEVDQGWHAAITMLGHERVSIGAYTRSRTSPVAFGALAELARGTGLADRPLVRDQLVGLYMRDRALQLFNLRLRQEAMAGRAPGARGSIAKLVGSSLTREGAEVLGSLVEGSAVAWRPDDATGEGYAYAINSAPGMSIAGGTSQIMRDIIGERVLGLPKEPQVDRGVPFRELKVGTQRG